MIPGSEHAFTFKTLADALLLRNHVLERFERADVEPDPRRKRRLLTFALIGGGLVGVELLGELTAFVDGITPLYKHLTRDEVRFLTPCARPGCWPATSLGCSTAAPPSRSSTTPWG
jgi:NADH dehydrogenase